MSATTTNNTPRATVNEILVSYYLNGKSWPDKAAKEKLDESKERISAAEYEIEDSHAQVMAKEFLRHASQLGYNRVKNTYWMGMKRDVVKKAIDPDGSKNVDLDSRKYPADVMVEFANGPQHRYRGWLGLSAKSATVQPHPGFKNPGAKTIEDALKVKVSEINEEAEKEFTEKHHLPLAKGQRKDKIRRNVHMKELADEEGDRTFKKIRDSVYAGMERLNQSERYDHMLSVWMNATDLWPPYLKVTGMGNGARVDNPKSNPLIDAFNKGPIKFEKTGDQSIQVYSAGKKLFLIGVKSDGQKMAGSVKFRIQET